MERNIKSKSIQIIKTLYTSLLPKNLTDDKYNNQNSSINSTFRSSIKKVLKTAEQMHSTGDPTISKEEKNKTFN